MHTFLHESFFKNINAVESEFHQLHYVVLFNELDQN